MATKTLTITEDAYDRLFVLKEEDESFSEVIRRLTTKVKLSDFAGLLTNEEAKKAKEKIALMREVSTKRMDAIRERLA
ncbi:antitoxin VapB family protein [Candidatus Woesearchaeota archaeon]|nr:antitoxin VapB family protein [Candidatus Woesearchaeota archaeon]